MVMDALAQDFRFGLRYLSRRRWISALAVVILALGVGTTGAIFSIVDRVLLQPLPYGNPDSLVVVRESLPGISDMLPVTEYEFVRLSEAGGAVAELSLADRVGFTLLGADEPESLSGARVSANFFSLLGARPALGRGFLPGEDRIGGPQVAVVSYDFYRRRFGLDPDLAGKTLRLSSATAFGTSGAGEAQFTLVGVLAPDFRSPFEDEEIWTPLPLDRAGADRTTHGLFALGRLRPGVALATARARLASVLLRTEPQLELHQSPGRNITLVPLPQHLVRDIRVGLWVLFVAVGLVMLIVCVNVANLQLALAIDRRREIALRTCLGAGRARLLAQLLTESLVLSLLGGIAGILLAFGLIHLLLAANPGNIPRLDQIGLNPRVLGFSLLLSLATGLLIGAVPAFRGLRVDLTDSLRSGIRSGASRQNAHLRGLLLIAQTAVTLVLLIGAGLLAKSLYRLTALDYGFQADHVLTVSLALPTAKYPQPAQQESFFLQLLERARALPGVKSAGLVNGLPLGRLNSATTFGIVGRPSVAGDEPTASYRLLTDGYLEAMNIPLRNGRPLVPADVISTPPPRVALIDQAVARRYFPGEDPVGRLLQLPGVTETTTIVGVVGEVVQRRLSAETQPTIYLPLLVSPSMSLVLETGGDPLELAAAAASTVRSLDREQPVEIATMSSLVSNAVARPRFNAILLGLLALLALVLAIVGIYGTTRYAVTQRLHELGVRLALGAPTGSLLRQVLLRALALTLIGTAAGGAAAYFLTRYLESLLYGIGTTDKTTFAATAALLLAVTFFAAYGPARRATEVNPTISLQQE